MFILAFIKQQVSIHLSNCPLRAFSCPLSILSAFSLFFEGLYFEGFYCKVVGVLRMFAINANPFLKYHLCKNYHNNNANTKLYPALLHTVILQFLVRSKFPLSINTVIEALIIVLLIFNTWNTLKYFYKNVCVFESITVFLYVSLQILVNSVSPNRPMALYEKVIVSEGGSPLLRDMLFSPDQQYIYTLTDRQVSSLLEMHK